MQVKNQSLLSTEQPAQSLRFDWYGMGVGNDVQPSEVAPPLEMLMTPRMSD